MFCEGDCVPAFFFLRKRIKKSNKETDKAMDTSQEGEGSCIGNTIDVNNGDKSENTIIGVEKNEDILDNSDVKLVPVFTMPDMYNVKKASKNNISEDWMKRARKHQQGQYNTLGDRIWDVIDDESHLGQKIEFALYGISVIDNNDPKQTNHVNNIKTHIIKLWDNIKKSNNGNTTRFYFASVFVYLRSKNNVDKDKNNEEGIDVLFRIPKVFNDELNSYLFIDGNCRTYDGWDDYLCNNKLPKCDMCYPLNGVYTACNGIVNIDFKESPACNISKSIFTGLDITSSVLTLGATGVSIASLAVPVAAPFVWGAAATIVASGAYDITRYVNKLIDIKKHHESLSLKNPESRGAWIGLAATAAGVASVGGTALSRGVLASEQVITRSGVMTLRVINLSSIAISGVGVVNSLITVVMKFINGTMNKNDLLQFTSACYFFLNAIVSLNIADRLIKDVASSDITYLFCSSKNCAYSFTKSAIEFTDSSTYHVLRSLVLGRNSQLMPDIDFNYLESTIYQILSLINRLSIGSLDWIKFAVELSQIMENIWFRFKDVILKSIEKLTDVFKIDWKSYVIKSGYKPFANSSPDIARQFCMSIHKTISYCDLNEENTEYINDILSLIDMFNNLYPCDYSFEFLNRSKFICENFIKEFDNIREEYELNLDLYQHENQNQDFDLQKFNSDYGIDETIDKNICFFKKTLNKLKSKDVLKCIYDSYCSLTESCVHSLRDTPCMETNMSTHYIFSGPPGRKSLTDQEYWQKVNDIANCDINNNNSVILSQNGIVLIKPNDENNDVKAVIFYSTYEKGCIMGILTVLKNISLES